jgi:hypothetical protein
MFTRPYYNYRPFLSPLGGGLLGSALLVCGLIAVGNLIAPKAVEQLLPHWQAKFGLVVTIGVVLGFARSIWRLVVPLGAIGFWLVALFSVADSHVAKYLPAAHPATAKETPKEESAPVFSLPSYHPSSPAVPDNAYFPSRGGGGGGGSGFGFLKGLNLPDFIKRLIP